MVWNCLCVNVTVMKCPPKGNLIRGVETSADAAAKGPSESQRLALNDTHSMPCHSG